MSGKGPSIPQVPDIDAEPPLSLDIRRKLAAEYRPWRTQRYVAADTDIDPVAGWRFTKAIRNLFKVEVPVARAEGGNFGVCWTPAMQRALFLIDRASGDDLLCTNVEGPLRLTLRKRLDALFKRGELVPKRMQTRTAMTEAAESSIIEGASATRARAMELLRAGQAPRSVGERMIVNNYEAMQLVRSRIGDPLSLELLLELQSLLTAGTLDVPDASGRFRLASEDVGIIDTRDDSTIFVPPPADQVVPLLKQVCTLANAGISGTFVHPLVLASMLHFFIGYVHPFVDGNGRTARAVFYWAALRHGYSLFEYLSISEIIGRGFAKYPQAYLDTEKDEGDLTYFVLYQLSVVEQALSRLSDHLQYEEERVERSAKLAGLPADINLRQRLLIEHALRHPQQRYTVKGHSNSNGTTLVTARTDLDQLVKLKLLTTQKDGREVIYLPAPMLAKKFGRSKGKRG